MFFAAAFFVLGCDSDDDESSSAPREVTTTRVQVVEGLGREGGFDPDQIYEQGGMGSSAEVGQRGRVQAWEYRNVGVRLVFVDQSGFGRWRLTPSSNAEFESAARRLQAR